MVPPTDPDLALGDYAGAKAPDREYTVAAGHLNIAVHEWGSATDPPLFMAHGGFDFARTYDVFAPIIAAAGWRVVSWDHRGHGDSDHAELYSWEGDLRDAMAVMDSVTREPAPVIGHSKGGVMMIQLADAQPYRFSHLINLDGIPNRRRLPDVSDHERSRMLATDLESWLDLRRTVAGKSRRPDTLERLAERRRRMNPRLSSEWLRHLVTVGGRHDADGWRWKIDPSMRLGGFGPWRPEWTASLIPGLGMPFLGILGEEPEEMGFGTKLRHVQPYLTETAQCVSLPDVGHFVHIEKPELIASMVFEFVGDPS